MHQPERRKEDAAPQIEGALELRRLAHHQQRLQLAKLLPGEEFIVRDAAHVGEAAGEVVDVASRRVAFAALGEERGERGDQFLTRAQVVQVEQAFGGEAGVNLGEALRFGLVDLVQSGANQEARRQGEQELATAPRRPRSGGVPFGCALNGSAAGDGHISEGRSRIRSGAAGNSRSPG